MTKPIYIVGCGGVTSYLLPVLFRSLDLLGLSHVVLIDGDILEPRNLDRQLFRPEDIGRPKAEALASHYESRVTARSEWFVPGFPGLTTEPLIIGAVDNHTARRAILGAVDELQGACIFGANEYWESEAYYYSHDMKDGPHDPRVFYPTLLTDTANDPTRPRGCAGAALEVSPQLAAANFVVAGLIMHLLIFWREHIKETFEVPEHHPLLHRNNISVFTTVKRKDRRE